MNGIVADGERSRQAPMCVNGPENAGFGMVIKLERTTL
jgi:hypothetical protein